MAPQVSGPSSSAGPQLEGDSDAAKLAVWREALYERVKETGRENDLYSQDDLLKLDVIPNRDAVLLLRIVQSLTDDKLFVTMREASGQVFWKWRDAQEAHKYVQLNYPHVFSSVRGVRAHVD
jgi:DNA-directed RNA polymerase III subunit RPC6